MRSENLDLAQNAPTTVGNAAIRSESEIQLSNEQMIQAGKVSLTSSPDTLVLFDGDSIAVGVGASPERSLARQVWALLPVGTRVNVVAAPSRQVQQCLILYDKTVAPMFDASAATCVIFFHAGDNDIAEGSSAAVTHDALCRYVARAHDQGWAVVVSTKLQRFDFPPAWQDELEAYNVLLRADHAGADGFAEFGADPLMGGREERSDSARYTLDGVHPSNGGYAALAQIAVTSLLPMLVRQPGNLSLYGSNKAALQRHLSASPSAYHQTSQLSHTELNTHHMSKFLEIKFGNLGNSVTYMGSGWSVREVTGTWMIDTESTLIVPRPERRGDYLLEIDLDTFAQGQCDFQRLSVRVNGVPLCNHVLYGNGMVQCWVPWLLLSGPAKSIIILDHPDGWRPADMTSGEGDQRVLSFHVRTATLSLLTERIWEADHLQVEPDVLNTTLL